MEGRPDSITAYESYIKSLADKVQGLEVNAWNSAIMHAMKRCIEMERKHGSHPAARDCYEAVRGLLKTETGA